MASERQIHFRNESIRRFENLETYVEEKIKDGFPIQGNYQVMNYLKAYLEFLYKQYIISKYISKLEKEELDKSDCSVAKYLKHPELTTSHLEDSSLSVDLSALNTKEIKRAFERIELAQKEENKYSDLRERILNEKQNFYNSLPGLTLADFGPAIGALSTMLALKTLDQYGLAGKTKIYLIDVSKQVLDLNQRGEFSYPPDFVKEQFGSVHYFNKLKSYLGSAELIESAIDEIVDINNSSIDISLVCFLIHHIADEGKHLAGREVSRVTRGAIFVADEYFENYNVEFGDEHQNDKIPLAPEEPIPFMYSMVNIFPNAKIIQGEKFDKYYAYWATKDANI